MASSMLVKVDLFTWKAKIARLISSVSYSFSHCFLKYFPRFGDERHGFILVFRFQASYADAGSATLVFTRGSLP